MYRPLLIAVFFCLGTIFTGASSTLAADSIAGLPPAPTNHQWQPIPELSDEFTAATLDPAKWMPKHAYWAGREPSRFDSANVRLRDGNLELKSTTPLADLSTIKNPEKDVWVTAACISSQKPIASYGYYEARMKASRLSMTSSFWFQGKYSEIDVVEQLGAPIVQPARSQLMLMNTHYFKDGWKKDIATPRNWKMPSGAADDYHVYGVWWIDQDTVWFYHDGQKVAEAKTGGPFLEPMYLFFDTEVFTWEGLPTLESLKDPQRNTLYVDWVRAWKLVEPQSR